MTKAETNYTPTTESLDDNWASAKRNRDAVLAIVSIESPESRHAVERVVGEGFGVSQDELTIAYNSLSMAGKITKRGNGEGYRSTHFAAADQQTETYQAMKNFVDGAVERHQAETKVVQGSAADIWQMYLRPGSN